MPDQLTYYQSDLEHGVLAYLPNKLHYFSQVLLLLENLLGLCPQRNKFRKMFVVIFVQSSSVLAVTNQPVDRGEMFPLSQLLV